jgi:hypothetical protein
MHVAGARFERNDEREVLGLAAYVRDAIATMRAEQGYVG